MHKLVGIKVGFSEHEKVNNTDFTKMSVLESIKWLENLDRLCKREEKCYYKTDVTLIWEDGFEYKFRYDLGDGLRFQEITDFTGIIKKFEERTDTISIRIKEEYIRIQEAFKDREGL